MELAPILSAMKDFGVPTGLAVGMLFFLVRLYVKQVKESADARVADKDKVIARLQKENDAYKSLFAKMLGRLFPHDDQGIQ